MQQTPRPGQPLLVQSDGVAVSAPVTRLQATREPFEGEAGRRGLTLGSKEQTGNCRCNLVPKQGKRLLSPKNSPVGTGTVHDKS